MAIRITSFGKNRQAFVKEGEAEYLKRLKAETRIDIVELEVKVSSAMPAEQVKEAEAKVFLHTLKERSILILLDEEGTEYTSEKFAVELGSLRATGASDLVFGIGGAHGWHSSVKERAHRVISLSRLTFPYQLARLILIEQLYRAFMILKGSPYHKG